MSDLIQFVRNYTDLSTDNGFQYEFFCDRCGSGFRTRFREWKLGTASDVVEGIGGMIGGIFGRASSLGNKVKTAAWEKAHDGAFNSSVQEIKPEFSQCPRCSKWVCRAGCWSEKKGLCKECAPDLGVEMAAAQASKSVEEVWAHAKMSEEDKRLTEEDWREGVRATCPKCSAPLASHTKFCPSCGAKIVDKIFCGACGKPMDASTKFCPECGAKHEG
ncbi:MAG: zinc ribbon domain-containing protein [bacterium]|nr:zinc ribbon domain-containing protein [bacterium]